METANEPLRIKDAKSDVLTMYTLGVVGASVGLGLVVHSYWHTFDIQMLIVGIIVFVIGTYFVYRAKEDAIQKYHALTKGLFPKPA